MSVSRIAVFLVIVSVLYGCLHSVLRKEYRVHSEGIVLLTGASTGIGRHAAEHLADKGYTVFCGVRKQSDADRIASLNNKHMIPVLMDVTDHDSCVSAIGKVRESSASTGLPFVALVNNAGISRKIVAEFHDLEDARKVFETNFFGAVDLTQLSLPLLRESRGRVIMISSLSGRVATPMSSIYAASKFALEAFSDSLRREVAGFNISVSIIEPAYVATQIFESNSAASSKVYEDLDSPARTLYPSLHSEEYFAKRAEVISKASPATVTSEAIAHAISSATPQTRYVVANVNGLPAVVMDWLQWALPDRLVDILAN